MGFILGMLVAAASLWAADFFLAGVFFEPPAFTADAQANYWISVTLSAVVLGVLNTFVRPILFMLSLPITCLTLGLFILVLNGLMLVILSVLPLGFRVDNLFSAIVGSLVVSVTSFVLNRVLPR
jgi:putative membrane protein